MPRNAKYNKYFQLLSICLILTTKEATKPVSSDYNGEERQSPTSPRLICNIHIYECIFEKIGKNANLRLFLVWSVFIRVDALKHCAVPLVSRFINESPKMKPY